MLKLIRSEGMLKDTLISSFVKLYGSLPEYVVRAPGRVNIIGEHTDYNDGFVLPMAINRAVWIALRSTPSNNVVTIRSIDFKDEISFNLEQLKPSNLKWGEYVKGVAWALKQNGYRLRGWEGCVMGDVPLGAGLSSSAALELAAARAFSIASDFVWSPTKMAQICQTAENQWVGVNCGIMDQLISAVGVKDHAVLIDCRSLHYKPYPLPQGTTIVVLDTATRRGLVDSAYNLRRQQCEFAARYFGVKALRDVTMEMFKEKAAGLDEIVRKRARHIITENDRTQKAAAAMIAGDVVELGNLMNESHESLKNDFEVSSAALDIIVDEARKQNGCFGARMTGAGFGGCAVALVMGGCIDSFREGVYNGYTQITGTEPVIYVCRASDGAGLIEMH